ncbi:MAG: ACP S-malonyltransferase [bacterium]|nr:ACP S-malonyltransferase [bacterium]
MKDYAFLFPGQGSQVVGMGKDLAEQTEFGKETFQIADNVLGYSLSKICFEGPAEELQLTHNGQPALLTVSYILYKLLGKEPSIAAGHSLGEYSALLCAGAIDFEDAVLLVHKRGKYMQEAVPVGKGAMAAIMGAEIEKIREVMDQMDGRVNLANWNNATQVVISGEKEAVEEAVEKIGARKNKFLPVSAPFHSQLMQPAQDKLSPDLDNIHFNDLAFPVINNIETKVMTGGDEAREALKKQVTGSVLWHNTILKLLDKKKIGQLAEIGSGRVLTGLAKRTAKELELPLETFNIRDLEDLKALTEYN